MLSKSFIGSVLCNLGQRIPQEAGSMKTQQPTGARASKLAFLIPTVLSGFMLAAATVFEYTHNGQTANFSGFLLGALVCLFTASLAYSKHLSVASSNSKD